jgi:hypothetical protein
LIFARCGGLAAVLAGVLFAAWGYVDRGASLPYLATITRGLAFFVPLLFLVGLVGLRVRYDGLMGWLAGTGFALGFVGATWGTVLSALRC